MEQEPQEKDDKRNEKVENEESGPDKNVDSQIEPMKASDVEKQGKAGESPSDQVKYKASQFDAYLLPPIFVFIFNYVFHIFPSSFSLSQTAPSIEHQILLTLGGVTI